MFWKRKRKEARSKSPAQGEISEYEIEICRANHGNLDLRRAILDWRDHHMERIELELRRGIGTLYVSLDQQLATMTMRDIFIGRKQFSQEKIEPIYREWLTREVAYVMKTAQDDLSRIFNHALEAGEHSDKLPQDNDSGHYRDAVLAITAIVLGVAGIPTFMTLAVVSVGGILGIFGVTTIALPVVAAGIVALAALLSFAGYKGFSLKSNAIRQYRKAIEKAINSQVLGQDGKGSHLSVVQNLQAYIEKTANNLMMEIDQ